MAMNCMTTDDATDLVNECVAHFHVSIMDTIKTNTHTISIGRVAFQSNEIYRRLI